MKICCFPFAGVDWAQKEVTNLYSKIYENGYKLLYLSARSISQAGATRDYLRGLQQGSLNLPQGPLFLNPESIFKAFKKEVIDKKPETFKISCLTKLQDLFVNSTPYFAGYGNRPNDVIAYQAVGIPRSRIFIVDKAGELKAPVSQTRRSSYKSQSGIADFVFPPISHIENNDSNYWSFPVPEVTNIQPL